MDLGHHRYGLGDTEEIRRATPNHAQASCAGGRIWNRSARQRAASADTLCCSTATCQVLFSAISADPNLQKFRGAWRAWRASSRRALKGWNGEQKERLTKTGDNLFHVRQKSTAQHILPSGPTQGTLVAIRVEPGLASNAEGSQLNMDEPCQRPSSINKLINLT